MSAFGQPILGSMGTMRAIASRKRRCCPLPGNGTTVPRRVTARGNCRFIHDVPNAAHDRHDCERLIAPDALCEASPSR